MHQHPLMLGSTVIAALKKAFLFVTAFRVPTTSQAWPSFKMLCSFGDPRPSSKTLLGFEDEDASQHLPVANTVSYQDEQYPFAYSSLPSPTFPSAITHWRGNEHALFMLDPQTKVDIQDYLLGTCTAQDKGRCEPTKPTDSKIVYILDINDEDEEQLALCVSTNTTMRPSIYHLKDAQECGNIDENPESRNTPTIGMHSGITHKLVHRRGNVSLTHLIASADSESFPLTDFDLNSDDDSDDYGSVEEPVLTYSSLLDIVEEYEEEEPDVFEPIAHYVSSRYCRDPHFTGHPTCHCRIKNASYAHEAHDAETDLRERFTLRTDSGDSTAHYLNWQALKWTYGETMVHGQSSLRVEVLAPDLTEPFPVCAQQPASMLARPSSDSLSSHTSVFSPSASVTTKPSSESFVSEDQSTLDHQTDTALATPAWVVPVNTAHIVLITDQTGQMRFLSGQEIACIDSPGYTQADEAHQSATDVLPLSLPRLSWRRRAQASMKGCFRTVRDTVKRGAGGVSSQARKMGVVVRGLGC